MHKSYRGKGVDMEALRKANEKTVAAGNANTNAKGDTLGKGGTVKETVAKRTRRTYNTTKTQTSKGSIKQEPVVESLPDLNVEETVEAQVVEPVLDEPEMVEVEDTDGNITLVPKEEANKDD